MIYEAFTATQSTSPLHLADMLATLAVSMDVPFARAAYDHVRACLTHHHHAHAVRMSLTQTARALSRTLDPATLTPAHALQALLELRPAPLPPGLARFEAQLILRVSRGA